jgi:hypothetical protein
MMRILTIACAALTAAMVNAQLTAQEVRGRVVDERTRTGIPDAAVVVADSVGAVVARLGTDDNGFFQVRVSGSGEYAIQVETIGYATQDRVIRVGTRDLTVPAFVMATRAIPLDPLEANVREQRRGRESTTGFRREHHLVSGARLAQFERQGATPITVIRDLGPVRVRQYKTSSGQPRTCIESNRRMDMLTPRQGESTVQSLRDAPANCQWVVLVVDGIIVIDPETTVRSLNLQDFESIEYLSPVEAGYQYGLEASSVGAVVFWTRGRGPHVDSRRNVR